MRAMFNSLQSRLLVAFLSLKLITLFVIIISLLFYYRFNEFSSARISVEHVLANILQIIKSEQDFFNYETINPHFFRSGKSEYIDKHEDLFNEVRQDLNSLLEENKIGSVDVDLDFVKDNLQQIIHEIESYEASFQKLIVLTKERGFKDDGLVGRMRENIHEIERLDYGISKTDMLMLRRHEKDYIIRKDTIYAVMLENLANRLLKSLKQDKSLQDNQRTYVSNLLVDYLGDFKKVTQLETRMGFNNKSGERGKMRIHADKTAHLTEQFFEKIDQQVAKMQETQFYIFLSLITLAALFSLFISYVLASRITKPIAHLSQVIQETVKDGFTSPINVIESNSRDEVGELTRNFNFMLQELYQRLIEIKEKTHELELQNEELNAINSQILESESRLAKLNAVKDKFFSIISHDLRSPLHTVKGFMCALESQIDIFSPTEIRDFAIQSQKNIERILELLENLLQWSLSETGDLDCKPCNLNLQSAIQNNLELYKEVALDKQIALLSNLEPGLQVKADPNMLDFVLRNLLSNAIKFSNPHSQVCIAGYVKRNNIEVAVIDQGVGMNAELLKNLFNSEDRYSALGTKQEKGTGFGLLLCKNFIEKNNGRLSITSQEGQGTAVKFTLERAS